MKLGLTVSNARDFEPPKAGSVVRPFVKEHWGALQMLIGDPDGRELSIEAQREAPADANK